MDSVPISGLQELMAHLDELVAEPHTPLQPKVFDDVELQLTDANIPPLLPTLLPKLTAILHTTPHDPKIPVDLTIRLLAPVSFTQILSLANEDALVTALTSPAPSANILAMTILGKATSSPSETAALNSMPRLLQEFLRRWLAAPQVDVGEKGNKVLGDLLQADCELPPLQPVRHAVTVDGVAWTNGTSRETNGVNGHTGQHRSTGQGHLWSSITQNPDLFNIILALPQARDPSGEDVSQHQATLAQGRILRVLPRLAALNFGLVNEPLGSNGEDQPMGGTGQATSLLRFAAVDMVDKKDMLMHLSLIDFFEALVSLMRIRVDQGGNRAYIVSSLRSLFEAASLEDNVLKASLLNLPDRTVPEEAEGLRDFILQVVS